MPKRSNYLSWDDYFMSLAILSAQRSKDPKRQVGACIVTAEHRVVGIGYNGLPIGCHDDEFPWHARGEKDGFVDTKHAYVCHAELNAIVNANTAALEGCTLYVTLFPCNECAKLIIQKKVALVVYLCDDKHDAPPFVASRRMFQAAGVEFQQAQPARSSITLDLSATPAISDALSEDSCVALTSDRFQALRRTLQSHVLCSTVGVVTGAVLWHLCQLARARAHRTAS